MAGETQALCPITKEPCVGAAFLQRERRLFENGPVSDEQFNDLCFNGTVLGEVHDMLASDPALISQVGCGAVYQALHATFNPGDKQ